MATSILTLFQNQDFEACIAHFESHPHQFTPIETYFVGISYLFCESYEISINTLYPLYSYQQQLPDYFVYLAFNFLKKRHYKKAHYYLKKVHNPTSQFYYETYIEVSLKLGMLRRTKRLIKLAESSNLITPNIRINKAVLKFISGDSRSAETLFIDALETDPKNEIIIDYLLTIYIHDKSISKSTELLEKVILYFPKNLKYIWKLYLDYTFQGNHKKLDDLKLKIKTIDPKFAPFREVLGIPSVYDNIEQIKTYRNQIETTISDIKKDNNIINRPDKTLSATPFFLSYHDGNNKSLLTNLSEVLQKGVLKISPLKKTPHRKRPKIGIISHFFHNHSVMNFYLNTITQFPDKFHISVLHVSPNVIDETTKKIKKHADDYYQLPANHDELVPFILERKFDVIIYPEIGMSPCIYYLAMIRLAPIQITMIGHPETSGMSTIDYYISWKEFHKKDPQDYFSETVIQLSNFPICYDEPQLTKLTKPITIDGFPEDGILYFIPMLTFKLHPSFDHVIATIIKENPNHYVLIIRYNEMEKIVINRLKRLLNKQQMSQLIASKPFLINDYFHLLKRANVVLETFPFGGGNTMLHTLAVGTPYVTLDSPYLRGSFGSGYYRFLNHTSFIADSIDDYINKAIAIANNPKEKESFRLFTQKNQNKLFNNMSGTYEFYDWLSNILAN